MPLIETQPDAMARIYAKAVFDLANAQGGREKTEATLGELEEILEMARADARFGEFLSSRSLGVAARETALTKIFKFRVSDLTLHFLLVVNRKGRLGSLSAFAAALDSLVQGQFGRVEVDVFTAEPLDGASLEDVRGQLARTLNKDVVVHPYVEPAMIGGVKFRIGDQLLDASVATRLRKVKDQLENQGAAAVRAKISRILDGNG